MIYSGSSQFNISVWKTARVQAGRLISALFVWAALGTSTHAQVTNVVDDWAPTEARLSTALREGDSEQKRNALLEIRNLRSDRASRIAIPALRDKEPIVRATAAASVVFAPKSEASGALVPLLDDKQEFVRREAAYALGEVQDRAATAPLLRLMQQDKILEVRTAAAISLGRIGDPTAVDSLLTILKSRPREDDEFLRRSAARSIGQIAQISVTGNESVLTPQNFLPEKFKDLGSSASTGAIPPAFASATGTLTTVLQTKNESDDTRREAAFALGAIGDQRSIPVLKTYLSGNDPYLAEICKEALLKIERRNKTPGSTD
jgi:HEAT repeat protein